VRRLIKGRSRKTGLSPGTLIYIGERTAEKTRIHLVEYDPENFRELELAHIEECRPAREKAGVVWVNVIGLRDVEVIEQVGNRCGLHPLLLEDVLNINQRPKLEEYDGAVAVIVNALGYDKERDQVAKEQVGLVLGPGFVISFQERDTGLFDSVKQRIRTSKGHIRHSGPDYLLYALLDSIVDTYFEAIEAVQDQLESIEADLLSNPTHDTLRAIQQMKTETMILRKSIWPVREMAGRLERGDFALIEHSTLLYLRDIYDHSIQAADTTESLQEVLAGMLEIYLSSLSNAMNAVVKGLTLVATIFLPLTLLVGIYGMNFDYMPELQVKWAYPAVWIVMIGTTVGMLVYFRRKRWL
jgi:magnesium transporter